MYDGFKNIIWRTFRFTSRPLFSAYATRSPLLDLGHLKLQNPLWKNGEP